MKTAVYSTKPYDRQFLDAANAAGRHELLYLDCRLTVATAALAEALTNIAATTIANIDSFEQTGAPLHPVTIEASAVRAMPETLPAS